MKVQETASNGLSAPVEPNSRIIEEVYDSAPVLVSTPDRFAEIIVILGLHESYIHRVVRGYFNDYTYSRPPKKGFKGTYAYLLLTKYEMISIVFAFRREFYTNQLTVHKFLERADKIKVILLVPAESFENANCQTSFEYLHKELESLLSLVPHNNRSVGLAIVTDTDDGVNVDDLLQTQVYRSELFSVFRENHVMIPANSREAALQQMKKLMQKVDRFGITAEYVKTRFFHRKHYNDINKFVTNYNQRLTGLSKFVAGDVMQGLETTVNLTGLSKTFERFMDVALNVEFDEVFKQPINLTKSLTDHGVEISGPELQFSNTLNSHTDLLQGAKGLTVAAKVNFLFGAMKFLQVKSLQNFFPDSQQQHTFVEIISTVIHKIYYSSVLYKLQTPFSIRLDEPSKAINRSLAPVLKLHVNEIHGEMDESMKLRNKFDKPGDEEIIAIILSVYKAELVFMFVYKFGINVELLEPFLILRSDFDDCLTKVETRLSLVIGKTIGDRVRNVLDELIPQLKDMHKPIERTRESTIEALKQMTGSLKKIATLRKEYQFAVDGVIEFVEATNTTVSEDGMWALQDVQGQINNTLGLLQQYHSKYHGEAAGTISMSGEEELTQNLILIIHEFKAKAIANIIQRLVTQMAKTFNTAVVKFDVFLNTELRLWLSEYKLSDPDDWAIWRNITKQPFERVHLLQDIPQSIGTFVRSAQLFCDSHHIPRPEDILDEMSTIKRFFDDIEREMLEEIQTPINTTFQWGHHIRLSHSYLLNSASTSPSFINSGVNWMTGSSAFSNAVELGSTLVFATFIVKTALNNLFK